MGRHDKPLFQTIDCLELYTPDIQKGLEYYSTGLGLNVVWKTETSVGLGMGDGFTEIVIQNERTEQNTDVKVASVIDAVQRIKSAGGRIIYGPFDIPVGKCAVVEDPWKNRYVLMDMTKGSYKTDDEGNIIGLNSPE